MWDNQGHPTAEKHFRYLNHMRYEPQPESLIIKLWILSESLLSLQRFHNLMRFHNLIRFHGIHGNSLSLKELKIWIKNQNQNLKVHLQKCFSAWPLICGTQVAWSPNIESFSQTDGNNQEIYQHVQQPPQQLLEVKYLSLKMISSSRSSLHFPTVNYSGKASPMQF